jgi:hypothetical protein
MVHVHRRNLLWTSCQPREPAQSPLLAEVADYADEVEVNPSIVDLATESPADRWWSAALFAGEKSFEKMYTALRNHVRSAVRQNL